MNKPAMGGDAMSERALIITYYWPPSGGPGVQRYLKFAKYLPRFGVEPIILTVQNPTYPILDPSLEKEVPPGLRVYRTRTVEPFGLYAGLLGQKAASIKPTIELEGESARTAMASWIRANLFVPDARTGWYLTARKKAAELIETFRIGTVITTGPPHSVHLIGRKLHQTTHVRWLADLRDPWTRVYYNQLLPRSALARQLDERLEQGVLRQADEVIVVTPSQAELCRTLHERAYRVITNGFDPADFRDLEIHPPPQDRLLLRHIGTIGEAAVPDVLLETLAALTRGEESVSPRPLIEFIGEVHNRLPQRVEELGLEGVVRFRSYLPHREALEAMCGSDALLLSIPDVEEIRHHIPGKLFEYIGSGRPILLLGPPDGDAARIVTRESAGMVSGFRDVNAIRSALENLIHQKMEGGVPGTGAITASDHPFSRITLTEKLARLIRCEEE